MKLEDEMLQGIPNFIRDLEGSRHWVRMAREEIIHHLGEIDFSEIRRAGDSLDLYEGDELAFSVAQRSGRFYVRGLRFVLPRAPAIPFWRDLLDRFRRLFHKR